MSKINKKFMFVLTIYRINQKLKLHFIQTNIENKSLNILLDIGTTELLLNLVSGHGFMKNQIQL